MQSYSNDSSQSTLKEENLSNDWSFYTNNYINILPQVWTRGLLYFLIFIVSILVPWASLSKVDETGNAQGQLEYEGKTIRRDAGIESIINEVHVQEGDEVKKGQKLLVFDSKSVTDNIKQNEAKLKGQEKGLKELLTNKNQLESTNKNQLEQNKAEESRQQIILGRIEEEIKFSKNSYREEKEEILTQIESAKRNIRHSKDKYSLAQEKFNDTKTELSRYSKLYEDKIISKVKVKETERLAKDELGLQKEARYNLEQAEINLQEQQQKLRRFISKNKSDIEQAKLNLEEQKKSYQSLIAGGKISINNGKEKLNQINEQIYALESEISQTKNIIESLKEQLKKHTIKAKQNGTILELPFPREGKKVQANDLIFEIAPDGIPLVYKGFIAASESESLRRKEFLGKDVNLKFDEYPFQDYGVVKGKLIEVSPTSKRLQTPQGDIWGYEITVKLAQSCIQLQGNCYPFKTGQPATAEIIIRQRRIIDYILDPFKKLQQGDLKLG